jgi:VWFA-related protein
MTDLSQRDSARNKSFRSFPFCLAQSVLGFGPWALGLTPLAFGLVLFAQEPQTDRPVFRAGVNLVRLDVRVVDDSGRPITDLRPDEVAISEGASKRPIVLFQRVAGAGRTYVESAQRTIASDVSTNQGAPQGQLFVFVFDQDHIRSGNEQPVRLAADAFLRTRVTSHDRVAIYGLPGPGPAQPFTANLQAARQQLAQVRGGLERRQTGAVTEMTIAEAYEILRNNEKIIARFTMPQPQDAGSGATNPDDLVRRFAGDPAVLRRLLRENAQTIVTRADADARRFLQSLVDLLHGFRGIDGRKTVMVFSEGFYSDNVGRDLEDVAAAAAETYSVIYAFDLNRRTDVTSADSPSDDAMETANRIEPLGSLAAETSGELLKDAGPRLDSALGTLVPDDGEYYLIGFEPAARETGDSAYRRMRVHVTRPGARVIARTGYAIGAVPTPADRRPSIDTALRAPFTQQALRLEYTTYMGQSATAGMQRVVVSLMAELPVARTDTSVDRPESSTADVTFLVRNFRTGEAAASGSDRLALPVRTAAGFSTGTASWRVGFDLPAGDYIMRCVIREPGGIIGSADRRFRVRALDGPEVAASDLILDSPGETLPVRARGYTEGTLFGTARLYGPSTAKLDGVTAKLELTPVVETPEPGDIRRAIDGTIGEVIVAGRSFTRDVTFAMPLERLPPGAYVAHATVRQGGELVADLRRPVDVIAGTPPAAATAGIAARPRDVLDGEPAQRLIRQMGSSQIEFHRRAAAGAERRQWAQVLSEVQNAPPEDAAALVLRGLAQIGREEYGAAAAVLSQAFDARPDDAALTFVLGWARIGAADHVGAIGAFRNAARIDPKMTAAYLALAKTYTALGHPALAVQSIEAGLRELPESSELRDALTSVKK